MIDIPSVEAMLSELKFARDVRERLVSVRLIHESDKETLERVLRLARKSICARCNGYGHTMGGSHCADCDGSGAT